MTDKTLKGEIANLLSDYGIPILGFVVLISAMIGFIKNYDDIMDKDHAGTRTAALIRVAYIIGYPTLMVFGLIAIIRVFTSIDVKTLFEQGMK